MKNRTLHTHKRILAVLAFTLVVFILQSGCKVSNAPPLGGILVRTFESIQGIGNSQFPLPNVPNAGNVLPNPDGSGFIIYGAGTGTQTSFQGITDASASSAYPNARTNARWQVTAGPSVAPFCGAATGVEDVPPEGMIFKFVCDTLVF